MVQLQPTSGANIIYPESDGQPIADNTEQFRWIVVIKENLELLFADDPMVFVAGDLLWYPVQGNNTLCQAPDAMVAFGRPKGRRGSYLQWQEANIAPQVVFEILSPSNRLKDLAKKFQFYDRYGVEEYYLYDPDHLDLSGWLRSDTGQLAVVEDMANWVSPRLGIRFDLSGEELQIYRPDGRKFLTFIELEERANQAEQRAEQAEQQVEQERQRAKQEHQRAEQERQRAEQAEQRAARLAEQLRSLGLDPDQPSG
jgi:Uma2 family endonuclease